MGNVGNILLKIAMYNLLKSLKFEPCIIGTFGNEYGLDFLKKTTNIRIISNFSEIKKDDYNILIVNSDQTWRNWGNKELFYNIAFLKFAENWNIHKFTYGVSLGNPYLDVGINEIPIVKRMISNFSGFSVREKSSIGILNKTLGIKAEHVIDPTLFFNKDFYLNLINITENTEKLKFSNNSLFRYFVTQSKEFLNVSYELSKSLNYDIFSVNLTEGSLVNQFIVGINNCKSVVTDSFHATIFSILFNCISLVYQILNI